MSRFGVLRGDGLLRALSAHFELSETRVAEDGLVRTRFYQKFGLLIRESVRLPEEEREEGKVTEEETEILPGPPRLQTACNLQTAPQHANGYHIGNRPSQRKRIPSSERRPHPVHSPDLRPARKSRPTGRGVGIHQPHSHNGFELNAEELLAKILGTGQRARVTRSEIPAYASSGQRQNSADGVEARASGLICLVGALYRPRHGP